MAEPGDQDRGALRLVQHDARESAGADADLLFDEPRRPAAEGLCDGPPEVPHAAREHHHDRSDHRAGRGADAHRGPRTAGEHRHAARVRARQHRHHHPAQDAAGRAAAVPHAGRPVRARDRRVDLSGADGRPAARDVGTAADLAGDRAGAVFFLFSPWVTS